MQYHHHDDDSPVYLSLLLEIHTSLQLHATEQNLRRPSSSSSHLSLSSYHRSTQCEGVSRHACQSVVFTEKLTSVIGSSTASYSQTLSRQFAYSVSYNNDFSSLSHLLVPSLILHGILHRCVTAKQFMMISLINLIHQKLCLKPRFQLYLNKASKTMFFLGQKNIFSFSA